MSTVLDALEALLGAVRPLLSPPAIGGSEHARYGGYLLRQGDRDPLPNRKAVYAGKTVGAPAAPANYVTRLNRDLRASGYLQASAGVDETTFTRGTELAVREFQADLGGTMAARVGLNGVLEGVPRAATPVQVCGFLFPPTGVQLAEWVTSGWRCPTRVLARSRAAPVQPGTGTEVWAAGDVSYTSYRMHGEDVSNVFQAGRWEGNLGRYTRAGNYPGGPLLHPGEAKLAAGDPAWIGDDAVRRAVRAVANAETGRTWDSINAWDGVGISTGLFHWTPWSWELGGFATYLHARTPTAYHALFTRQGLSYPPDLAWDLALAPNAQPSFDVAQRKWIAPLQLMGRDPGNPFAWTNIGEREPRQRGPYHEFFATWRWVARMAQAARSVTFEEYRIAQAEMAMMRLQVLLATPMVLSGGPNKKRTVTVGSVYRTRLAMAVLLRMHVFDPKYLFEDTGSGEAALVLVKPIQDEGVAWDADLTKLTDATIDDIATAFATKAMADRKGTNLEATIKDAKAKT